MKAIHCSRYGPPEDLRIVDIPTPEPKEGQVLVRVHATAVNDYDWSMVRGKPMVYRLLFGLVRPRRPIPGMELAGTIAGLGKNAGRFQVGDAVYGDISDHGFGSFAEYIAIHENALEHKPNAMSFEDATALPHAALLAYQGLYWKGKLGDGKRVLINGAGGGVGSIAIQLAKQHKVEVTAVDSGAKSATMSALGADHTIDHTLEDFTRTGERYDLILDCKLTRSPADIARALTPQGMYVCIGGEVPRMLQLLGARLFGRRNMHILALKPNVGLDHISALYTAGQLRPVVDGPYPLAETPRLIRYFGEGKHTGKVVITIPT